MRRVALVLAGAAALAVPARAQRTIAGTVVDSLGTGAAAALTKFFSGP